MFSSSVFMSSCSRNIPFLTFPGRIDRHRLWMLLTPEQEQVVPDLKERCSKHTYIITLHQGGCGITPGFIGQHGGAPEKWFKLCLKVRFKHQTFGFSCRQENPDRCVTLTDRAGAASAHETVPSPASIIKYLFLCRYHVMIH